ncbi:MAG: hypothetical protein IKX44_09465 [Prevotella sp.]|nr:hypothetical protein [Prevotella sp.]
MEDIVQWATILSPIIAVLLAWWAVWSSSRDASRQIDSVKKLTRNQLKVAILETNQKIWEADTHLSQINQREMEEHSPVHSMFQSASNIGDSMYRRAEKSKDLHDTQEFLQQQRIKLRNLKAELEKLEKEIDEGK